MRAGDAGQVELQTRRSKVVESCARNRGSHSFGRAESVQMKQHMNMQAPTELWLCDTKISSNWAKKSNSTLAYYSDYTPGNMIPAPMMRPTVSSTLDPPQIDGKSLPCQPPTPPSFFRSVGCEILLVLGVKKMLADIERLRL